MAKLGGRHRNLRPVPQSDAPVPGCGCRRGCCGPDLIPESRANLSLLARGSRLQVGEIPDELRTLRALDLAHTAPMTGTSATTAAAPVPRTVGIAEIGALAVVLLSYYWVWNVGPQILPYLAWPFQANVLVLLRYVHLTGDET